MGGGTGNFYQIATIPELMDEAPGIDPETQLPVDDPEPRFLQNFHLTGFTSTANPGGLHWPAPFYGVPNTLVFEDTLLTTNQTAFEDIYIGSNVLIAPGTVIRAGKYIEIDPVNRYDPDVLFEIGHLTGKEVKLLKSSHTQTQGDYRESFDINDLAPGIYLLVLQADDYREAKKLVVVR